MDVHEWYGLNVRDKLAALHTMPGLQRDDETDFEAFLRTVRDAASLPGAEEFRAQLLEAILEGSQSELPLHKLLQEAFNLSMRYEDASLLSLAYRQGFDKVTVDYQKFEEEQG